MTNLWLQTQIDSIPNEFWYVDYEKGIATKSNHKPQFESIRKWNSSMEDFLKSKEIKILEISDYEIKFEVV